MGHKDYSGRLEYCSDCPILKKGDPTKTINYKKLSLLDACYHCSTIIVIVRKNKPVR